MRLGIIGTAGRQQPVTEEHWALMQRTARELRDRFAAAGRPVTELVSGGAAGADHVAVRLFLEAPEACPLYLALAANWDESSGCYEDNGQTNWLLNPGRTLNRHLRTFTESAVLDPFAELGRALRHPRCRWDVVGGGLRGRNSVVAEADVLLAMTFGHGREVAQGGTADTCRKYLAGGGEEMYHLDLNTGVLYSDAVVARDTAR